MQQVTLNEIITAVRELTFDRFVIPAFALKQTPGMTFSIIPTREEDVEIPIEPVEPEIVEPEINTGDLENTDSEVTDDTNDSVTEEPIEEPASEPDNSIVETEIVHRVVYGKISFVENEEVKTEVGFDEAPTLESLMHKLIEANIVVAYTPYFMGSESVDSLIKVTDKDLSEENCSVFRKYFFSDKEIVEMIKYYYSRVLRIELDDVTDDIIGRLKRPSERHLVLWVSYHLVDRRRLYENAANAISQTFTDGSDYVGSGTDGVGSSTTVQIGSVFSITEDPTRGFFYEDFNRVGSDNVWGDRYSFWYKLMVYLRNLLEQQFGDYSLRPNMVIPGNIELQRELDFRSYYDSYPFTLSPLSRGIVSKVP